MSFEKELLQELDGAISKGLLRIETDQEKYHDQINEKFNFSGSKIDFNQMKCVEEDFADRDEFAEKAVLFFEQILSKRSLTGNIIILSDSSIDYAIISEIKDTSKFLPIILSYPQHLYIVPDDYSWCMFFSFEGDCYFGYR